MAGTNNYDYLVEGKKDVIESILKDLRLASEKLEPKNVSDEELSRLGLTTISDCHCLHALCANREFKAPSTLRRRNLKAKLYFSG